MIKAKMKFFAFTAMIMMLLSCMNVHKTTLNEMIANNDNPVKMQKSDEEWRKLLTPLQFNVLREKGTERPFTGEYYDHFEEGWYHCAACSTRLFRSDAKFESGCGWPSFFEPSTKNAITYQPDNAYGMSRTETICTTCGGHLGHVFEDGPPPTGLRFCINSAAIVFVPATHAGDTSAVHQSVE